MNKLVEFFFDFGSPTAYLAYTQLPAIAKECNAEIVWRPMLLDGVFKATGNQSPVMIAPKGRWMGQDMAMWARRYGVPTLFVGGQMFFGQDRLEFVREALRQP